MVQVFFDDKSVQTFVSNDKRTQIIWPGFADEAIAAFSFFEDEAGTITFGTTEAIAEGDQVLWHIQLDAKEPDASTKQPLFFQGATPTELKTLEFIKFPQIQFDADSELVTMHYWTNIPATQLDSIGQSGVDKFTVMDSAAEPFQTNGTIDTTLQRVVAFTRARFADLFDNREGSIIHRPSLIFERPQFVFRPDLFDSGNQAEQVLDVHTAAGATFLEFIPVP